MDAKLDQIVLNAQAVAGTNKDPHKVLKARDEAIAAIKQAFLEVDTMQDDDSPVTNVHKRQWQNQLRKSIRDELSS